MARLTGKERKDLPTKDFAGPARHARNALSRVSQYGTAELKKQVRAAVHRKFPGIGKGD